MCEKRAELFGTPEHDRIKWAKCTKRAELFGTPEHDRVKQAKCAKRAELFGTPEHDQLKKAKRECNMKKKTKNSDDRILKFTTMIQDGPYYVCAVCNRCLYHRSVIVFNIEKYEIQVDVPQNAMKIYIANKNFVKYF